MWRLGNFLNDNVIGKKKSNVRLHIKRYISFSGEIIQQHSNENDEKSPRYFSRIASYVQNLQNELEVCMSIYVS